MRAWGAAVSSGHLALGLAGWLLLGIPPWFFGGCALLTLGVALLAAPLMQPAPDDGGDDGAAAERARTIRSRRGGRSSSATSGPTPRRAAHPDLTRALTPSRA